MDRGSFLFHSLIDGHAVVNRFWPTFNGSDKFKFFHWISYFTRRLHCKCRHLFFETFFGSFPQILLHNHQTITPSVHSVTEWDAPVFLTKSQIDFYLAVKEVGNGRSPLLQDPMYGSRPLPFGESSYNIGTNYDLHTNHHLLLLRIIFFCWTIKHSPDDLQEFILCRTLELNLNDVLWTGWSWKLIS